jgi:hypothetical protein
VLRVVEVLVPLAAVHEEVKRRAEEQQEPRERAEEVRAVFLPQEEEGDHQEPAEPQPERDPQRRAPRRSFRFDPIRYGCLQGEPPSGRATA